MANHPKLIVIPGTFLDAVEKLLHTAPPPKTARDRADRQRAARIVKAVRKRGPVKKRAQKAVTRKKAR